jgi:hypothetical protein
MYGADFSATLRGRSDGGSIPIAQDDDLAGRIIAALQETAEWQWIREQMRLDEQSGVELNAAWREEEAAEEAHGGSGEYEPSEPSGPIRHRDNARYSRDEADEWQQQVEHEESEPSPYELHEIRQGRRLHDDEEEPMRTRRTRRSKERSRFHVVKNDPNSGKPIYPEFFQGSVPQDQPITGSYLESNRDSILTSYTNGSLTKQEAQAALEALRKHKRAAALLAEGIRRITGDAQGVVDTSVKHDVERSEEMDWGTEAEDEAFSFAQRALSMDQQARAQQAFAHGQRIRHAKKLRVVSQTYRAPGWIQREGPLSSKEAALALARHCLTTGANYDRALAELPA